MRLRVKNRARSSNELTPTTELLVKQLTEEIMAMPNHRMILIALYGVIRNLPNRAVIRTLARIYKFSLEFDVHWEL